MKVKQLKVAAHVAVLNVLVAQLCTWWILETEDPKHTVDVLDTSAKKISDSRLLRALALRSTSLICCRHILTPWTISLSQFVLV